MLRVAISIFGILFGLIPALALAEEMPRDFSTLKEYETSVYEDLLAQQIGLRSPSNFNLLRDEYGRRADNHQEEMRHKTWLAILHQKNTRKREAILTLAQSSDPWLKQIAQNSLSPRMANGRSLASNEACPEASSKFLNTLGEASTLTRLRWVSLMKVFGESCVNAWLKVRFQVREMVRLDGTDAIAVKEKQTLSIVLVGFDSATAEQLKNRISKLGTNIQIQSISAFSRIEERASELKNTVRSDPDTKTILISHHSGGAVVLALLDQYPHLKRSGDLVGWIAIDTWLRQDGESLPFGNNSMGENPHRSLPQRNLAMAAGEFNAQMQDAADFSQFMTEPVPSLGDGFRAYSIATRKNFSALSQAIIPQANNILVDPSALNATLLEILGQGFGLKENL